MGAVEVIDRVAAVVEPGGLQAFGGVAALARHGAARARELALVRVAVAALAGLRHAGESERGARRARALRRAGGTAHKRRGRGLRRAGTASGRGRRRPRARTRPGGRSRSRPSCAKRANSPRCGSLWQSAQRVDAKRSGTEGSCRARGHRPVALVAGHREVRAEQRVAPSSRAPRGRSGRGGSRSRRGSSRSGRRRRASRELAGVGVGVAVRAAVVLQAQRPAGHVAASRRPRRVAPGERVGRRSVVEAGCRRGAAPARGRVAARAVRRPDGPCGCPRGSSRSPGPRTARKTR